MHFLACTRAVIALQIARVDTALRDQSQPEHQDFPRVAVIDLCPRPEQSAEQYLGVSVTAAGLHRALPAIGDNDIDIVVFKLGGCAGAFPEVWPMIEVLEAYEREALVIVWGASDICGEFAIAVCGVDRIVMSPQCRFWGCVSTANANEKNSARTLADYAAVRYACRLGDREPLLMAPGRSHPDGAEVPISLDVPPLVHSVTEIEQLPESDDGPPDLDAVLAKYGVGPITVVDIDAVSQLTTDMENGIASAVAAKELHVRAVQLGSLALSQQS